MKRATICSCLSVSAFIAKQASAKETETFSRQVGTNKACPHAHLTKQKSSSSSETPSESVSAHVVTTSMRKFQRRICPMQIALSKRGLIFGANATATAINVWIVDSIIKTRWMSTRKSEEKLVGFEVWLTITAKFFKRTRGMQSNNTGRALLALVVSVNIRCAVSWCALLDRNADKVDAKSGHSPAIFRMIVIRMATANCYKSAIPKCLETVLRRSGRFA
mmetsp:Transcript_36028/g.84665  ORF Transcript_36028/g.84665 Transcript_36028/m.84665 type:complete len:220 (+) Transcript_36028:1192-1851(+)|eukprot:749651-Rhodomonas_salina.1